MKKYLVKTVSTPTELNENFKHEFAVYYYGKKGKSVGTVSNAGAFSRNWLPSMYQIKEYGYDRVCDAKRSWNYNNPQNDDYWRTNVQIVEYEV